MRKNSSGLLASFDENKKHETRLTRKIFLVNMIPFFIIRVVGFLLYGFDALDAVPYDNAIYLLIHLLGGVVLYNSLFLVALHWCELIHYVHSYGIPVIERRMTIHRTIYVLFSLAWFVAELILCIVLGVRRYDIMSVMWCQRIQLTFDCFLWLVLLIWFVVFNVRMRATVWNFTPIMPTNEAGDGLEAINNQKKERTVFISMILIIFMFGFQVVFSLIYFEVYMDKHLSEMMSNQLADEYLANGVLIKIITECLAFLNYYIFSDALDVDRSGQESEETLSLYRF
jgi:hypothetical protein